MRLKRVEEWTKGKPRVPALASALLVIHAEEIHSVIKDLSSNRTLGELLGQQDTQRRGELYRDPLKAMAELFRTGIAEDFPEEHAEICGHLGRLMSAKTMEEVWESVEGLLGTLSNGFEYETGDCTPEEAESAKDRIRHNPVIGWLFKVWLPSLILYRQGPHILRGRAESGDAVALEDLAAVDKDILFDSAGIRRLWQSLSAVPGNCRYERVMRALRANGLKKIKRPRMKVRIAAAMEAMFEAIGGRIARSGIRDLFDAFAADIHKEMIDGDLPEGEEAFSKAINRERKAWSSILREMA